jgi:hypothetical protein
VIKINNLELMSRQKEYYNLFDQCLQKYESKLFSSEQRGWGKTTILNEIGFTYQALGYDVLIVTKHIDSNEHYATLLFDYVSTTDRFIHNPNKTIAIIDEYNYFNENCQDIINYFTERKIPYVGFVNFNEDSSRQNNHIRQKQEEDNYKYIGTLIRDF